MIFYISDLYKKFVTRNNALTSKPVKIFNHTVDEIDVSIVDQQNQLKQIPSGAFYFTGSFVKKAKATPIFLSTDYTVSGTTLTFKYSTYTYEFLNLVIGENVPIQVEIGYKDADGEHVILQDTAYASQRYYVEGMPDPSHVAEYYTKTETDAAIAAAISGIELSGYVTTEELEEGLATKQNTIDEDNKLPYSLISDTPEIPLSTSQLTNDSGFITDTALEGLATETYVNEAVSGKADETALTGHTSDTVIHVTAEDKAAWSGKQDAITVDNKLDYALLSGTPEVPTVEWGAISGTLSNQTDLQNALNAKANTSDIPLSTSQLTNDSGFVTSGYVDDALSGKQDKITYEDPLDAHSVTTELDPWQGDPEFRVDDAINEVHREALEALSGVDAVSGALSGKQDAITNDNKLDYGLLSGTPTIPLSTSQLTNDSGFTTSGYVDGAVSGKLDKTDYVAPYKLPYDGVSSPNGTWFQEDIGTTMTWSNTEIIPNDQKIVVASFTTASEYDHLVFPTLYSASNQNVIKTCELWVKMAGSASAAQGIAAIVVPSSYFIVDEDNFPTSLKGEAENNESYTYHVFVIRAVPRQFGTLCEVAYSHYINTNLSI